MVFPRFTTTNRAQAYDRKWLGAAKEATSNPGHAMIVVRDTGSSMGASEKTLLKNMHLALGKRLIVVSEENIPRIPVRLSNNGLVVSRGAEVVRFGAHYAKDQHASMCIGRVGAAVRVWAGAESGKSTLDERRSIRWPTNLLLEQFAKLRKARHAKPSRAEIIDFSNRVLPFLQKGFTKYGEILRLAKENNLDFKKIISEIRGRADVRLKKIINNREISNAELDELLTFSNWQNLKVSWRLLIEMKKERVSRGTYKLKNH